MPKVVLSEIEQVHRCRVPEVLSDDFLPLAALLDLIQQIPQELYLPNSL
jgi:hypothetical protein